MKDVALLSAVGAVESFAIAIIISLSRPELWNWMWHGALNTTLGVAAGLFVGYLLSKRS